MSFLQELFVEFSVAKTPLPFVDKMEDSLFTIQFNLKMTMQRIDVVVVAVAVNYLIVTVTDKLKSTKYWQFCSLPCNNLRKLSGFELLLSVSYSSSSIKNIMFTFFASEHFKATFINQCLPMPLKSNAKRTNNVRTCKEFLKKMKQFITIHLSTVVSFSISIL